MIKEVDGGCYMAEIQDLDFILSDIGWDKYGGKSFNVWGTVPMPKELLTQINKSKNTPIYFYDSNTGKRISKENKKSSIWTAFDNYLYSQPGTVSKEELPRISATFKSCFSKYSAIAENIGMQIAVALDLPTSYNYIVKFNPDKFPQIINNYPTPDKKNMVLPYGIVSIDFLQTLHKSPIIDTTTFNDEAGKCIEISSIDDTAGEVLISFEEALEKYHLRTNNLDGSVNLVKNWINVIDEMVKKEFASAPKEVVNKIISQTHSRIARSYLLKDSALGDCDFTAYNGGVVINPVKRTLRYAPNHDFGECFNGLIRNKLEFDPYCGMSKQTFSALPKNIQEKILSTKNLAGNKSIREIARMWASSTSEENFYYILENFPEACEEFFESLDLLVQRGQIDKIINKYSKMTCNGTPLLTPEETEMFKEYLYERISYICDLYINFLNDNHKEIPQLINLDNFLL